MKLKKYSYIMVLALLLFVGINKTYADDKTCYYASSDNNFKVSLRIGYNIKTANPNAVKDKDWVRATIFKTSEDENPFTTHFVENWSKNKDGFSSIYKNKKEALDDKNPSCPRYLVYAVCPGWLLGFNKSTSVFATNSSSEAASYVNSNDKCSYKAYGSETTKENFLGEFESSGLIVYDDSIGEYTCEGINNALFGTTNNPTQLRNYIDTGLQYIRILVPILIILLGTLDFGKAVLAGKEDEMKKAQSTFIKRLIAGVIVFFIPLLVDLIMDFADIVWQGTGYTHCDF